MEETNNESIEKKLAYLNETKGLIKSAIINKGQELTDETPFRDYVQKIDDIETGVDTSDATALASDLLKGKTAYNAEGKIEGTLELKDGDVKLFETQEEMQSDPNAQEGDLAVVYRSEIQNIKNGDTITSMIFPKTVVFDTAITTNYNSMLRNLTEPRIYLHMQLSSTGFRISDMYGTIPEITYTSSDGITYTRTDTNEDTYEIGETTISNINEHICKFIQAGGMHFEGLFEYSSYKDKTKIKLPLMSGLNIQYDSSSSTISSVTFNKEFSNEINFTKLVSVYNKFISDISTPNNAYIYLDNNNNLKFVQNCNMLCYDKNVNFLGVSVTINTDTDTTAKIYTIDLENETYTLDTELEPSGYIYGNSNYNWNYYNLNNKTIPFNIVNSKPASFNHICIGDTTSSDTSYTNYIEENDCYIDTSSYLIAPTQLTLKAANELLPGKAAYGANGVIKGDQSLYDNLDYSCIYDKLNIERLDSITLDNGNTKSKSLYSTLPAIEENSNTLYYRPITKIINTTKTLSETISTFTGVTDTYSLPPYSTFMRCENGYNIGIYRGSTAKNCYLVVFDDDNNIISADLLFTITTNNVSPSYITTAGEYYYFLMCDNTDRIIAKCKISDGTVIGIKHYTAPATVNSYQDNDLFTQLGDGIVFIDVDQEGYGTVLYVDLDLNEIQHIKYTFPDYYAIEYVDTAVIIDTSIYWFIRCKANRLFKFDGTTVTYGPEIGTGTGIPNSKHMFTDGTYIYAGWYGDPNLFKLDTSLNLVATLDTAYDSSTIALYNNVSNYDFKITDYLNYSFRDVYGHKQVVKDGVLQKNPFVAITLQRVHTRQEIPVLRYNNIVMAKPVLAELKPGLQGGMYNTFVTETNANSLKIATLYVGPISQEEYNTALDTAYSIRDDQVE